MMRLSGVGEGEAAAVAVAARVGDAMGVTVGLMMGRCVATGAVVGPAGTAGVVGLSQAANTTASSQPTASHLIDRRLNMRALLVRNWRDYSIGGALTGAVMACAPIKIAAAN